MWNTQRVFKTLWQWVLWINNALIFISPIKMNVTFNFNFPYTLWCTGLWVNILSFMNTRRIWGTKTSSGNSVILFFCYQMHNKVSNYILLLSTSFWIINILLKIIDRIVTYSILLMHYSSNFTFPATFWVITTISCQIWIHPQEFLGQALSMMIDGEIRVYLEQLYKGSYELLTNLGVSHLYLVQSWMSLTRVDLASIDPGKCWDRKVYAITV